MVQRLTRRFVLSALSGAAASAAAGVGPPRTKSNSAKQLPAVGEFVRFLDGTTEAPVIRLTSLSSANSLPARENRAVSVKGRFLVFSSDRVGSAAPFRLDLRSGQVSQLLATRGLDPTSLALDASDRTLFFLENQVLKQLLLANKRVEVLAEKVTQLSVGSSTAEISFVREGNLYAGADQRVLANDAIWSQVRPGGAGFLFGRVKPAVGEELWYVQSNGSRPVQVAKGPIAAPCWSKDGKTVFFLRNRTICEVVLETGKEQVLGGNSQFVAFSPNADGSVFVGAVRSNAQPTINLLLRSPAREFTLCEHRSSHPELCAPVFSSDSRRVYFNSDFQGKPAIYSVNVEALIEETSG